MTQSHLVEVASIALWRGSRGLPSGLDLAPERSEAASKRVKPPSRASGPLQDASRQHRERSKKPQGGPQSAPGGPKTAPRALQEASRRLKRPQDGPKSLQDASKRPRRQTHLLHYNRHGEVFHCRMRGGVNPSLEAQKVSGGGGVSGEREINHSERLQPRGSAESAYYPKSASTAKQHNYCILL